MVRILLATLSLLFLASQIASAQSAPVANADARAAASRPKICLVLSGGGARGAAHIGVLKELERLQIPIDCIAGTSMGSIVGGAYASGMSTADMEALVGEITTSLLFKEQPPRQDQAMRRKLDDRSILFGIELGIRDNELRFQKGIVTGIQLETVLRRLSKLAGFRKFDELPIPYRAVATDLVTGTAVVFHEGELASVMRASMSVPGAIAPAEVDGRLLVDGGLTNNLPIDVARTMGADIVIAVNLGTPLMKRENLTSVFGVTEQMINILTEQNVRASLAALKPTDILIEPELGDFSAADFDNLAKTIPIGARAVRNAESRLAALSLDAARYAALRVEQTKATLPDDQPVAEIRFRPMARVNPEVATKSLETQPGAPLDQPTLDRDMRRLFGTGDFEHVSYRILEEAGRRVLDIDAVEKAWGPNYLRFGLGLGSDLQGEAYFNAAASYRRTWINSLGGEWRTDLQIGHASRLATEFIQPFDSRRDLFIAPRAEIERRTVDLFDGSTRIARFDLKSADVAVELGSEFSKYAEARIGLQTGTVRAKLDIGPPQFKQAEGGIRQNAWTMRAIVDQFDSANFPRSGYAASMHVFAASKALGSEDVYTKVDADFSNAFSLGPHSVSFAAKVGGRLGSDPIPAYDLFQWGGFLQQSGYPTGALLGERLTFGRMVYTYRLYNQPLLEGLYVGGSLEAGKMQRPLVPGSPTSLLKSAALFVGADTPVGPFYLGFGRAADGNRSAYLFLGHP